ncbi:hypothetical protein PV08_06297 [Exophiala spinifera]|uniref:Transcription factor domain-containing protein n=1 Tax=Exophiala spinifera TaxID=91928 RepID=A0A0D1YMI1_9EURO|nr:uncharacterized protein PV08_06297 [Exophiala spinifera]KIW16246.1 hypothetical protein PV08_06297 [Exophiala spinifera]
MPRVFRVRFSKNARSVDPNLHVDAASHQAFISAHIHRKSRPPLWRLETPEFRKKTTVPAPSSSLAVDANLLQWWLDSTCKLFVLDPHSNPLSFPIVEHLAISPALRFAIESFSAGHKGLWGPNSRVEFLEKRGLALSLCRAELASKAVPLETVFFTVLLVGVTTPFMGNIDDYGKEHLIGARAITGLLLQQDESERSSKIGQILAYYTWWDMACSFCIDPQELPPLSTSKVLSIIGRETQPLPSRFAGCMVEIYHLLGLLLRYCMHVLRGGVRDAEHEKTLERALSDWNPMRVLDEDVIFAEAFQKHGLIIFHRVCHMRSADFDEGAGPSTALTTQIRQYAITILSTVLNCQIGTPFWNNLTIPLLTAGAELTMDDQALRENVRQALSSVRFQCQTITLMRAQNLLEEIWSVRDRGIKISYLELMLLKGWNFSLV